MFAGGNQATVTNGTVNINGGITANVFGGSNSAPIESCALAVFGVKTCKRVPGKKMLIG